MKPKKERSFVEEILGEESAAVGVVSLEEPCTEATKRCAKTTAPSIQSCDASHDLLTSRAERRTTVSDPFEEWLERCYNEKVHEMSFPTLLVRETLAKYHELRPNQPKPTCDGCGKAIRPLCCEDCAQNWYDAQANQPKPVITASSPSEATLPPKPCVVLTDEMVEKVACALRTQSGDKQWWDRTPDEHKSEWREKARSLISQILPNLKTEAEVREETTKYGFENGGMTTLTTEALEIMIEDVKAKARAEGKEEGRREYAEKYPRTDNEKNLQIMSYDEGFADGVIKGKELGIAAVSGLEMD